MTTESYMAWVGAQSTLNTLLAHWTDDNALNRQMAEMLLAQAILKTALEV